MADLIIPATLQIWLIFLLVFALLGYPVPFSIVFGAIGGLSGGIATAWWQVKGGAPSNPKGEAEDRPPVDALDRPETFVPESSSRWDLPFFRPNKSKERYMARTRRARHRRLR